MVSFLLRFETHNIETSYLDNNKNTLNINFIKKKKKNEISTEKIYFEDVRFCF